MVLAINEVFGPTVQGEGPSIGRPAAFLRVAGCNLSCSWCDTAYTWDYHRFDRTKEVHRMTVDEVVTQVALHLPPKGAGLLVITGGEPMLQQTELAKVLEELPRYLDVEIETAGTIEPGSVDHYPIRYNVSLKLEHSGNGSGRINEDAIRRLASTGRARWKFVVQHPRDLGEVDFLVNRYGLAPVYIMPEGTTPELLDDRMRLLVPHVIARGYTLTPRLHINLWGTERGH